MNAKQRQRKSKSLNLMILAAFAGIVACAAMIVGLSAVPETGARGVDSAAVQGLAARALSFYRGLFLDPAAGAGLRTALEAPDSEVSRSLLGASASPRTAASLAVFLGKVGRREALRTLAPLLARPEEAVHRAAEEAIVAVLLRHPGTRTWAVLGSLTTSRKLPFVARARLIQALAKVDDPRARECLGDLLGDDSNVDLTVLPALGAAIAAGDPAGASGLAGRVRSYLDSGEPALRRESSLFLGRIRDLEAVPALILLLDDDHAGVRDNAHWALCNMTGLRLQKSRERWSQWLAEEEAFVAGGGAGILDALQSGDEARIAEALRDVSEHPLLRPEAESGILSLLSDERPGIRDAAGHALKRLRSPHSALANF